VKLNVKGENNDPKRKYEENVLNGKLVKTIKYPTPRAIQNRNEEYCAALMRHLKPMEHVIYSMAGDGKVLPDSRLIGKGLSQRGRARLLVEKWNKFDNPVALSIDASRFDQHVSKELLEIEHTVYKRMCWDQEDAKELDKLLSWQLHNQGKSKHGIRYTTRGKRMSGDMNTALGNCILMIIMVGTYMEGHKYDMLDDGDDCLLLVEETDFPWVENTLRKEFLAYGMNMRIDNVARSLEDIEWCQTRPVLLDEEWRFIRNPIRTISHALTNQKYHQSKTKDRAAYVNTVGLGELCINQGVPILQSYAMALIRNSKTTEVFEFTESDSWYYKLKYELEFTQKSLNKHAPKKISDIARISFCNAFGIAPALQVIYERLLETWEFPIEGNEPIAFHFDTQAWQSNLDYRR
jgi:hypothetical protein